MVDRSSTDNPIAPLVVTATQDDREAMIRACEEVLRNVSVEECGNVDYHALTLAFAAHAEKARRDGIAEGERIERERAAGIAESCALSVPFAPGCADGASIASRQIAAAIRTTPNKDTHADD